MLWSLLISFVNGIIKSLGFILSAIVSILPSSPFQLIDNSVVSEYLSYLSWIIPVPTIISILQLWLAAISIFYLQILILRWVKAIN